jgi:hypothetical protein
MYALNYSMCLLSSFVVVCSDFVSLCETEDFLLLFSGQKSKQKDLSRWKSNHP